MARIKIETENGFLRDVCVDYAYLWKFYFKDLNKPLVWLTMILMLITAPLYLVYLVFYGVFWLLSFAQDPDADLDSEVLTFILKAVFFLPSYAFILFAYIPALILGGVIYVLTIPCNFVALKYMDKDKVVRYIDMAKNIKQTGDEKEEDEFYRNMYKIFDEMDKEECYEDYDDDINKYL